jgi:hypothetical protein
MYNEELQDFCSASDIIRVDKTRNVKWAGHVAHNGGDYKCVENSRWKILYVFLLKRLLRRPNQDWQDNIKPGLEEIGCEVEDWIHLAKDGVQWQ